MQQKPEGIWYRCKSIRFAPKELQAQARVDAMKNALAKAQTLAVEGDVTLGKPISISESSSSVLPPSPFGRDVAAEGLSATPIETGQLQVTVHVLYEIK